MKIKYLFFAIVGCFPSAFGGRFDVQNFERSEKEEAVFLRPSAPEYKTYIRKKIAIEEMLALRDMSDYLSSLLDEQPFYLQRVFLMDLLKHFLESSSHLIRMDRRVDSTLGMYNCYHRQCHHVSANNIQNLAELKNFLNSRPLLLLRPDPAAPAAPAASAV